MEDEEGDEDGVKDDVAAKENKSRGEGCEAGSDFKRMHAERKGERERERERERESIVQSQYERNIIYEYVQREKDSEHEETVDVVRAARCRVRDFVARPLHATSPSNGKHDAGNGESTKDEDEAGDDEDGGNHLERAACPRRGVQPESAVAHGGKKDRMQLRTGECVCVCVCVCVRARARDA